MPNNPAPLPVICLRALRSVLTPGIFGVFVQSLLITLAALIGFAALVYGGLEWLAADTALGEALPWAGGLAALILAWFLFPGIMPVIVHFFDNRIAGAIERRDYPASPQPAQQPFWPEFWHDVRFALLAVGLNLLALPLYLFPPLNLLAFYGLNGYLLGREFFGMVARRHLAASQAEALRRGQRGIVFVTGALIAFIATLPLVNLVAPFWGIAVMVHLFHQSGKKSDYPAGL